MEKLTIHISNNCGRIRSAIVDPA